MDTGDHFLIAMRHVDQVRSCALPDSFHHRKHPFPIGVVQPLAGIVQDQDVPERSIRSPLRRVTRSIVTRGLSLRLKQGAKGL